MTSQDAGVLLGKAGLDVQYTPDQLRKRQRLLFSRSFLIDEDHRAEQLQIGCGAGPELLHHPGDILLISCQEIPGTLFDPFSILAWRDAVAVTVPKEDGLLVYGAQELGVGQVVQDRRIERPIGVECEMVTKRHPTEYLEEVAELHQGGPAERLRG